MGKQLFSFAVLLAFYFVGLSDSLAIGSTGKTAQLKRLGSVGTKEFFYDNSNSALWNWSAASALCQASNMELASFEDKMETEFVRDSLRAEGADNLFWTAGKEDVQSPSGFIWNGTNNRLALSEMLEWFTRNQPEYCIFFLPSSFFYRALCEDKLDGVLCQIKN